MEQQIGSWNPVRGHITGVGYSAGSAYMSKMTRNSYRRMNRKRGRFVQTEDETPDELR